MPVDERERLVAVRSLDVLDTPAEERFDRITRLACRSFGVPVAAVTLVDSERQWLKSCQGLAIRETSRRGAFCAHTIVERHDLVVEDARRDERFRGHPFVAADPGVRFYAGHRLNGPGGHAVGVLCVVDYKPRSFSVDDRDALRDLALMVEQELAVSRLGETQRALVRELDEARRSAMLDGLTQAWNRRALDALLEREVSRARRDASPLAVVLVDIDHFKQVNDVHGHPVGDAVIRGIADRLRAAVRADDTVGRYGGEEFMVVLADAGPTDALAVAERVRSEIARSPVHAIGVTASVGVVSATHPTNPAALIAAADEALYRAKRGGRNRVCSA